MKFEADLPHCVMYVTTTEHVLFKFRYIIFIGVRNIKEMPGSVAIGTSCTYNVTSRRVRVTVAAVENQ